MNNQKKKELLEWVLPPKIQSYVIRTIERLINYYTIDQSLFKKNSRIKDSENKNRCFILGTGASTNRQDLSLLSREISIGIAGFFMHKDIDIIKPKYYVVNSVFKLHGHILEENKFVNWLKAMDETLDDSTIMLLDASDKNKFEQYNLFTKKEIYWYQQEYYYKEEIKKIDLQHLEKVASISELAISVALHLGFDKIYMLGFDHNWFEDGAYFDNERYNKYFETDRAEVIEKNGFDNLYQMQGHAKIFYKYKQFQLIKKNIYNANSQQDSYVDTFPKVVYENLFK